jgi:RPA family protein
VFEMESFKRTPTIRMLAAEVTASTVGIQSGQKDSSQPAIYLSPTGAEVNRVLIAGTAVEKEDVGTDNSFWRVRVADPTGVVFVSAGQYQPEAAKAIRSHNCPIYEYARESGSRKEGKGTDNMPADYRHTGDYKARIASTH